MKCFLFNSSTSAMKAKYIIDRLRLKNYVIKNHSQQGCSWCLVVNNANLEKAKNALISRGIQYMEIRDYE